MSILFKLLFLCFALFSFALAQGESEQGAKDDDSVTDTDEEDPEQQAQQQFRPYYQPPHVDAATDFVFPRYGDLRLPLGEPIEICVGFTNKGSAGKTFNVTFIYGSLRFSQDPNIILQNFSYIHHGEIVRPKRSVSFPWWFMPDSLLEPRDYFLSAHVDYTDEDNFNYTQLFFNDTIYMVDDTEIDLTYVFTYFLFFAIVGLVIYFVSTKSGNSSTTSTILSNIQTSIGAKPEVQKISTANVGSLDSWGSNQLMDSFNKMQEKEKKRKQQEALQKAAKKKKQQEAQNKK